MLRDLKRRGLGAPVLVIGDGNLIDSSGVIEYVLDLGLQTIPGDGFFLVAEATFTLGGVTPDLLASLNFENSDNVTHMLVTGFTGVSADVIERLALDVPGTRVALHGVPLQKSRQRDRPGDVETRRQHARESRAPAPRVDDLGIRRPVRYERVARCRAFEDCRRDDERAEQRPVAGFVRADVDHRGDSTCRVRPGTGAARARRQFS